MAVETLCGSDRKERKQEERRKRRRKEKKGRLVKYLM